jgi:hypothetical protein
MVVLPIINNGGAAKLDDMIHISTSVREFDREGDLLFEGFNFDLMSSQATCMLSIYYVCLFVCLFFIRLAKVLQMKQTTNAMDDPIKSLSQYILRLLQHFQKIENYRYHFCLFFFKKVSFTQLLVTNMACRHTNGSTKMPRVNLWRTYRSCARLRWSV